MRNTRGYVAEIQNSPFFVIHVFVAIVLELKQEHLLNLYEFPFKPLRK